VFNREPYEVPPEVLGNAPERTSSRATAPSSSPSPFEPAPGEAAQQAVVIAGLVSPDLVCLNGLTGRVLGPSADGRILVHVDPDGFDARVALDPSNAQPAASANLPGAPAHLAAPPAQPAAHAGAPPAPESMDAGGESSLRGAGEPAPADAAAGEPAPAEGSAIVVAKVEGARAALLNDRPGRILRADADGSFEVEVDIGGVPVAVELLPENVRPGASANLPDAPPRDAPGHHHHTTTTRRGAAQAVNPGSSPRGGPEAIRRLRDSATRRLGDSATRRLGDSATPLLRNSIRRRRDSAIRRPGDSATRRPGDAATPRLRDPSPTTVDRAAPSGRVRVEDSIDGRDTNTCDWNCSYGHS
jgi:hypothetical protein